MKLTKGKFIFGLDIDPDKDIFYIDQRTVEDDIKFSNLIKEISDKYNIIVNINLPFEFRLRDNDENNFIFKKDKFQISSSIDDILKLNTVNNDLGVLIRKVAELYKIDSVNKFGFRIVGILDDLNVSKFINFSLFKHLVNEKILDKDLKSMLESNQITFQRGNKEYNMKFEPYLKDTSKTFYDCNVIIIQDLPFHNIFEITKQEIKFLENFLIKLIAFNNVTT